MRRITGERKSRGAFGVDSQCKACRSELANPLLKAERAAKEALRSAGLKKCNVCMNTLPVVMYTVRRLSPDGLSYTCKTCARARTKRHAETHPFREWYQRNREHCQYRWRQWVAKNPGRHQENYRKWAKANPDKVRALIMKREAQKLRATPTWSDLSAIREIYKRCEQISQETGVRHEVDHIVPLRGKLACGLHVPDNLQILTWLDNRRKGARHDAFLPLDRSIRGVNFTATLSLSLGK